MSHEQPREDYAAAAILVEMSTPRKPARTAHTAARDDTKKGMALSRGDETYVHLDPSGAVMFKSSAGLICVRHGQGGWEIGDVNTMQPTGSNWTSLEVTAYNEEGDDEDGDDERSSQETESDEEEMAETPSKRRKINTTTASGAVTAPEGPSQDPEDPKSGAPTRQPSDDPLIMILKYPNGNTLTVDRSPAIAGQPDISKTWYVDKKGYKVAVSTRRAWNGDWNDAEQVKKLNKNRDQNFRRSWGSKRPAERERWSEEQSRWLFKWVKENVPLGGPEGGAFLNYKKAEKEYNEVYEGTQIQRVSGAIAYLPHRSVSAISTHVSRSREIQQWLAGEDIITAALAEAEEE